jgi:cell division protease FtsH
MVTKYGMSDKLGALAFEGNEGGRALFGMGLAENGEYSEKVSAEIDAEVSRIMSEAFARAENVVTTHRPILEAIAKRLIEVENIEREEYEKILVAHGIQPKRKVEI